MSGLSRGGIGVSDGGESREEDGRRFSELVSGDGDAQVCGGGAGKFRVNSETVLGAPLG